MCHLVVGFVATNEDMSGCCMTIHLSATAFGAIPNGQSVNHSRMNGAKGQQPVQNCSGTISTSPTQCLPMLLIHYYLFPHDDLNVTVLRRRSNTMGSSISHVKLLNATATPHSPTTANLPTTFLTPPELYHCHLANHSINSPHQTPSLLELRYMLVPLALLPSR